MQRPFAFVSKVFRSVVLALTLVMTFVLRNFAPEAAWPTCLRTQPI